MPLYEWGHPERGRERGPCASLTIALGEKRSQEGATQLTRYAMEMEHTLT